MSHSRLKLGKFGEQKSIQYLKNKGYKILDINFRSKLGELDIVARQAKTICFIEVKTRSSKERGDPLESITAAKKQKLSRLAVSYLKINNLLDRPARFDVVSVYQDGFQTDIKLIKNAFDLDDIYIY
jgi:putative endonuclease